MSRRTLTIAAGAAALAWASLTGSAQRGVPPPPVPAVLQTYQGVTNERLKHLADSDWLMIRRTYEGWGYSPLDRITPANVGRLQPYSLFDDLQAWAFGTRAPSAPTQHREAGAFGEAPRIL